MAISSKGIKILQKDATSNKYSQLVKVLSVTSPYEPPEEIDVTALDDEFPVSIPGRAKATKMECTYNYDAETYETVGTKISGTAVKDYMLLYEDKSAEKFSARAWQGVESPEKDGQIKTKIQFYITKLDHVKDASADIDEVAEN